jgi:RHS repeat-associated protein
VDLLLHKAVESGSSSAALFRILSLFLTSLVFLWIGMTSASGNFAVQGCVTLGGQLTAVHPQGGFAVEVQAAPGANRFPLVVTEANGTVTTKYVDLLVENSIPVIHRYDLNGNLESVAPQATPGSPTRTYQWDAVNRLVGITRILSLTETRKTEFLYNGEGSRIGKKEFINGVLQTNVRYFYGDTGVLQERSADGGTVLKTYSAQGEIDSSTTPPTPRYFTRDHLGSVREVVAQNGTLLARYDYKPYGKRVQVSGTYEAAKGYTGHDYHAASDLILTRYRAYDPSSGRWLSSDPIEEAGGLNLYGYAGNDPVNKIDALGDFPESLPILIGGGAPAIVGGTGVIVAMIDAALAAVSAPWSTADEGLLLLNEERLRKGVCSAKAVVRGGESAAAAVGRKAHRDLAERIATKPGWTTPPKILGKDGRYHQPDVITPDGRFLELKPNTPSGRAAGRSQAQRYRDQLGIKGRVIYYNTF